MTQTRLSPNEQIRRLLDGQFDQLSLPVLEAIARSLTSGLIRQRLSELEAEAKRLNAEGKRLSPDNPILRAFLADLEPELRRISGRIDAAAESLEQSGSSAAGQIVKVLAFGGVSELILRQLGIVWQTPSPEIIGELIDHVRSPAWTQTVNGFTDSMLQTLRNQVVRGMVASYGAETVVRDMQRLTESYTLAQAQTLLRTMQLVSFRDAMAIHQLANLDLLDGQIRVAVLDDRTCLSCIALSGTIYPAGERIPDHWNGRCYGVPIIKGRTVRVRTGIEWFGSLGEERQRQIAGVSAFELLMSEKAVLQDFVHFHDDPIFGQMVTQASVKSVLAAKASLARKS